MENQIPTQILNHLLNNEEFCRRVIPYLKPENFEGTHRNVFDLIVKFVGKHNRLPTAKVLDLELRKVNAPEDVLNNAQTLINEIKDNKNDKVDSQQGGLYIISDLCHYISPQDTLTKMNLVRDTFGRKPKTRG